MITLGVAQSQNPDRITPDRKPTPTPAYDNLGAINSFSVWISSSAFFTGFNVNPIVIRIEIINLSGGTPTLWYKVSPSDPLLGWDTYKNPQENGYDIIDDFETIEINVDHWLAFACDFGIESPYGDASVDLVNTSDSNELICSIIMSATEDLVEPS